MKEVCLIVKKKLMLFMHRIVGLSMHFLVILGYWFGFYSCPVSTRVTLCFPLPVILICLLTSTLLQCRPMSPWGAASRLRPWQISERPIHDFRQLSNMYHNWPIRMQGYSLLNLPVFFSLPEILLAEPLLLSASLSILDYQPIFSRNVSISLF